MHGVDLALAQAARLLAEFAFIPYARLDDVMVSYAAPGGGVGPHFDSYDVFLVQGEGTRRWRVSAQRDLELVPDAPLRILQEFQARAGVGRSQPETFFICRRATPTTAWPSEDCVTYSVGFRAPAAQELGARFLDFLHDRLALKGQYADPDLEPDAATCAASPRVC